jgi:hypothetical protein
VSRCGSRSAPWSASILLGAIAVLGAVTPRATAPSLTVPGTTGPVDRVGVAIPPVYPGVPPGFLRLPETHSLPVGATAAPGRGGVPPVVPGAVGDRPVWSPARLEPVVGIDAHGRVRSVLEYTPGRFER